MDYNNNCRIAFKGGPEYLLISSSKSKECIDFLNPSNHLAYPYNKRIMEISSNDLLTVRDLYIKVLKEFNIPYSTNPDFIQPVDFAFRFGNIIFTFVDPNMKVIELAKKQNTFEFDLYIIFLLGAGELFREDGYRFYMYSHEGNKHKMPHVHVETSDGRSGSIDILSLKQNKGGKLKSREVKKIGKILSDKRRELLEAWNYTTDGFEVDVDYMLGRVPIIEE